jgi:thiamine-monophosphate kinase
MCRVSGCGARARLADLPLSASAAKAVAAEPRQYQAVLAGGDDYEILASVPPPNEATFRQAASAAGIAVTRIGTMTVETEVTIEGLDGRAVDLVRTGWDHFASDANAQSR